MHPLEYSGGCIYYEYLISIHLHDTRPLSYIRRDTKIGPKLDKLPVLTPETIEGI